MDNNVLILNLDSNAFSAMKEDFNKVLRRTLGNMKIKESDEATLTLKLSIKLTETDVPDFDAADETAMKKIHKPRFDHKISSVMQIKTDESGSLKGEYELVWDEESEDWIMKPIDNGQRSFFDADFAEATGEEDCDSNGNEEDDFPANALPQPKAQLMPHEEGI